MLLNNEWVKNEIREEIKRFLETNENEFTTIQNLWDTAKVALRGKFIAIQAYLKKIETENQDGGVGRHTVPPRTTRTDRESNGKGVRHQGNRK